MKISIVTISFNQADFIERTILSVINQKSEANIEYIVVDAGSTDASREIIESYRDKIDHIIFESDNGASDGLNKGFFHATGDIFGFINSDDILLPESLPAVHDFMMKHKEIDVVSGNSYLIDSEDKNIRKLYSDKFNLRMSAYGASILIQPSTFFRKNIYIASKGFNDANKTNWDDEIFIDMALCGAKFVNIDNILSGYRVHDTSITGTMSTANKMKKYRNEMFCKISNKNISSYSNILAFYYKYLRKFINYRDTLQRIKNGKSYGRAL